MDSSGKIVVNTIFTRIRYYRNKNNFYKSLWRVSQLVLMGKTVQTRLIWLIGALLALPAAFAAQAPSIFEPIILLLGPNGFAGIYTAGTSLFWDSVLSAILFISITVTVLKGKFGKAMPVVLGLVLSVGFTAFEVQTGFRFSNLAPLAVLIIFGLLTFGIYLLLARAFENGNKFILALAALVIPAWIMPAQAVSWLVSVSPIFTWWLAIPGFAVIILIGYLLSKLFKGKSSGGLSGNSSHEDSTQNFALEKELQSAREDAVNLDQKFEQMKKDFDGIKQVQKQLITTMGPVLPRVHADRERISGIKQMIQGYGQYLQNWEEWVKQNQNTPGFAEAYKERAAQVLQELKTRQAQLNAQINQLNGQMQASANETAHIEQAKKINLVDYDIVLKNTNAQMDRVHKVEQAIQSKIQEAAKKAEEAKPIIGNYPHAFRLLEQASNTYNSLTQSARDIENELKAINLEIQPYVRLSEQVKKTITNLENSRKESAERTDRIIPEFNSYWTSIISYFATLTPESLQQLHGRQEQLIKTLGEIEQAQTIEADSMQTLNNELSNTDQLKPINQSIDFERRLGQFESNMQKTQGMVDVAELLIQTHSEIAPIMPSEQTNKLLGITEISQEQYESNKNKIMDFLRKRVLDKKSVMNAALSKAQRAGVISDNYASGAVADVEEHFKKIADSWKNWLDTNTLAATKSGEKSK